MFMEMETILAYVKKWLPCQGNVHANGKVLVRILASSNMASLAFDLASHHSLHHC